LAKIQEDVVRVPLVVRKKMPEDFLEEAVKEVDP